MRSKLQPLPLQGEENLLTLAEPSLWEKATVFMLYDIGRKAAVAELIASYGVTEGQANEAVTFAQSMLTGIRN